MQTDFTQILLEFKSIPQYKRKRTFMEISGYPHYENVCSNILKFYLDPTNEHGLKDLILNSLIQIIDKDFKFDTDFEKIEIHREYKTINDNRLDLVILTENYVVGIENKIFHHLHNDLSDYKSTIDSLCYNSRKPIYIVLSLNKLSLQEDIEKTIINSFINVTFEQVFNKIKRNIGQYLNTSNITYINHLTDFIKSIENLTPKTMENKALWAFFNNNAETIQRLTDSFNEYKNLLFQKIYLLNDAISTQECAPLADKKWIYKEPNLLVLVQDYTINSKFKLAVDTTINVNGWQIHIFGRNSQSSDFIFNVMCQANNFLPEPYENYEKGERLIYQRFKTNVDISIVTKALTDLLERIENYKKEAEENNNI